MLPPLASSSCLPVQAPPPRGRCVWCRRSLPRTGAGDAGAPPPPLAILRRASSWAPALPCARSWARRRRPALAALAPSLAAQDLGLLQRVVPLVVLRH
ncbi:hypothetical protein PAHAL_4G289800 [Panicum hallii]|uniref:Uncharacterized protein n=1 Tax=Panicum hallii TaxID=206008 RepID=A0A2T8JE99_9POAL|nr:hypothetical protein PAHAL_4G289800 [Panicum hallii]